MPESKKVVVKVGIHDDKQKRKALKAVSSLSGRIKSLAIDMKDKKLTMIEDVDPVDIVGKLKKCWHMEILIVGPAKEEKKDGDKKDGDKDGDKKGGDKKDDDKDKKKKEEEEAIKRLVGAYRVYNPYMTQHYCVQSVEEYPNGGCVIC